jgi:hypothetical protein
MTADLKVTVKAIKKDADLWEKESSVGTSVATSAANLRMSVLQAGIFQDVMDANNRVCDFVNTEGTRASQQMKAASTALRENARAYENTEAEVAASVPNGY